MLCYCQTAPRSGVAVKDFIDIGGYINNYTGEVKIVLSHHSEQEVFIKNREIGIGCLKCAKISTHSCKK